MKKLIVIAILFMATTCWADMSKDFFTYMNTTDITDIVNGEPNQTYGIYSVSTVDFMYGASSYFKEKGSILREWESAGKGIYCSGIMIDEQLYAICVDGFKVVIQPLTFDK